MRDPERINRIIEKLRVKWHENPDQRLGQLVENIARFGWINSPTPTFYLEDEQLEEVLDR